MKQAILLAAGEGQRLRPFTVTRPKAMLSIADKPILQYAVEALVSNGIRDIVIVAGYRKEQVFDSMGAGERFGARITYVTQASQLGTAHALAQTQDVAEDEFLVLPGDNLIGPETIAAFAAAGPPAVLVKSVENPSGYGLVNASGGLVRGIVEKPKEAGGNIVNTGIYAFSRDIFSFTESVLDIPDAINAMIAAGHAVKSLETDGTWLDVVYPWDILSLNDAVLGRIQASLGGTIDTDVALRGQISVGADTLLRSGSCVTGPVVIGRGCDIGPNACITAATSIGDNVVIAPFTYIKNSVIADDVSIGPGCVIEDSVIGRGSVIKGRFTACSGQSEVRVEGECPPVNVGAILGEGCTLGGNVVAEPGAIVGNGCRVRALKLLSGRLPDNSLVY